MKIWDPKEGKFVKSVSTKHEASLTILVLKNDQVAVGFCDGSIRIVDLDDDEKSRTLEKCHEERVLALVQLSNGYLVSAGMDKLIKVWDLKSGTLVQSHHLDTLVG